MCVCIGACVCICVHKTPLVHGHMCAHIFMDVFVYYSQMWVCVIFIIHGFHICKSIIMALLWSFTDMHRTMKNLGHPTHVFLAKGKQSNTMPSHFTSQAINKYTFHGLYRTTSPLTPIFGIFVGDFTV